MKTSEMIRAIADALANDAAIKSWCNQYYSQNQTVFVGLDMENPPKSESLPYLVIVNASEDPNPEYRSWEIAIGMCIAESEIDTQQNGVTVQNGFLKIEDLRDLVNDCFRGLRDFEIEMNAETYRESIFPLFACVLTASVKWMRSRRKYN
jgi:hypothetical protein